ncbi:hypothetical protein AB4Z13_03150 [Rhizobium sp. YAF28]|jgi:hypothetical protein|uniref:hypothetical protein n=1 Tax=Rhizobium sp. YAF28 TaxID=3233081 RepID=UPI003F97BAD5
MDKRGLSGLDLHFAGIHAPPAPDIALDVLFTRLVLQTKAKIIVLRLKATRFGCEFSISRPGVAFRLFIAYSRMILPCKEASL